MNTTIISPHANLHVATRPIFESPIEMPEWDFGMDNLEFNAERLRTLRKAVSFKQVGAYEGVPIYSARDCLFAVVDEHIVYFVKVANIQFPGAKGRYVTQVALWRTGAFDTARGLTAYIFWELLLPRQGAIMCDDHQTAGGRKFWENRVGEAAKRGAHVYLVDLADPVATEITSGHGYLAACQQAYGTADRHKHLRLLITQAPLTAIPVVAGRAKFGQPVV
jgi:hypothetical protein